jgi:parvulin-like peptidyl-prolyl isomerase
MQAQRFLAAPDAWRRIVACACGAVIAAAAAAGNDVRLLGRAPVRAEAQATARVVEIVPDGGFVTVQDSSAAPWHRVVTKQGRVGYVAAALDAGGLRADEALAGPAPPLSPSLLVWADAPLRSGPASGRTITAVVRAGGVARVVDRWGAWVMLSDLTGASGWTEASSLVWSPATAADVEQASRALAEVQPPTAKERRAEAAKEAEEARRAAIARKADEAGREKEARRVAGTEPAAEDVNASAAARKAEEERAAEAAKRAEAEKKAQADRDAAQAKRAEADRKADLERQAEEAKRAVAAQKAEIERQTKAADAARKAEAEGQADEAKKAAAARKAAAERQAEGAKKAAAARKADEERAAKAAEAAEAERKAEAERQSEAAKEAEAARAAASRKQARESGKAAAAPPPDAAGEAGDRKRAEAERRAEAQRQEDDAKRAEADRKKAADEAARAQRQAQDAEREAARKRADAVALAAAQATLASQAIMPEDLPPAVSRSSVQEKAPAERKPDPKASPLVRDGAPPARPPRPASAPAGTQGPALPPGYQLHDEARQLDRSVSSLHAEGDAALAVGERSRGDAAAGRRTWVGATGAPVPTRTISSIVARVNQEILTNVELEQRVRDTVEDLRREDPDRLRDLPREAIVRDTLVVMIEELLLIDDARALGIPLAKVYEQAKAEFVAKFGIKDDLELLQLLQASGRNWDDFRRDLIRQRVPKLVLRSRVTGRITVPEEDIEAHYRLHEAEWVSEACVHLREIVLQPEPQETATDFKLRLDDLLTRLYAGEEFCQLATRWSRAPSASECGLLPDCFNYGMLDEKVARLAFGMRPGDVEPVETEWGYHVLRLEEHRPRQARPLEAVRDEIVEVLRREKAAALIREYVDGLRRQATIEVAPEYRDLVEPGASGQVALGPAQ